MAVSPVLSPDSLESLEGFPSPSGGAAVVVERLHKSFGKVEVLHGLDLEFAPGELIAVIGRSGCGKSTLLRLLAGLETPTSGGITLDGEPLTGLNSGTRVMFQDARLMPWLRVGENVALGLPASQIGRAQKALREVGLDDRARDWPTILSGGQKQRVALARALASEPRFLLLDEPLGALDALTRRTMQQLIERVWQQHRFTAMLVTHDVEEAVALADRVVLIDEGRVVHEVRIPFSRPRDRANPEFIALRERILARVHEEESHSP
ncbi:MAG: ABC transporter ATP-binding protein [Rariglobus sp.]